MDTRVVIQYREDVAAQEGQPGHLAGEVFVVSDAAAAKALHPQADILHYADHRAFVAAKDASLNPEKPGKPSKGAE